MSNLIKRTVPVILSLVLLLTCLVSPAAASDFSGSGTTDTYDLLDYVTIDEDNAFSKAGKTCNIKIPMPSYQSVSYVDILVNINPVGSFSVQCGSSATGNFNELSYIQIAGSNFYRIYGNVPIRSYSSLDLVFTFDAGITTVRQFNFYQFNIRNMPFSYVDLGSTVTVSALGDVFDHDIDPGDGYSLEMPAYAGGEPLNTSYEAYISIDDWEAYDFIDLYCGLFGYGTSSIVAFTDDVVSIPVSYTYTSLNNNLDMESNGFVGNNPVSNYYMQVTLDLRGLDRSKQGAIELSIKGNYDSNITCFFYTGFVHGYFEAEQPSQFAILMNKLDSWFTSLVSGSEDDQFAADDFNTSVSDQSNELAEMSAVMNSVEAPELSGVDLSAGSMVDSKYIFLSTFGISEALGNGIFIRVLMMSITLAVAGFILYGKK